jgi:GTP-binding protein
MRRSEERWRGSSAERARRGIAALGGSLIIRNCRLVISVPGIDLAPEPIGPEFAIIGRSNVGKSSLINALLTRKIAHTSNTPGKTRLMNFYAVNEIIVPPPRSGGAPIIPKSMADSPTLTLVDLPGYGFAKVSKTERVNWDERMRDFILEREGLALVIHLIDGRHGPQNNDMEVNDWLTGNDVRRQVVLTKIDKIGKLAVAKVVSDTAKMLKLAEPPIAFSAETRVGPEELWRSLQRAITMPR